LYPPEATINLHCIDWTAIPEEIAPSGVGKRVLAGAGASLVMVRVPAGTKADRHNHPHEQFVQVLSGSGVLETMQGARAFGPGSVFHFPPDTWHAARFDSVTVLIETNLAG
jgi:quercetin dioxygenase-like cupin family protein